MRGWVLAVVLVVGLGVILGVSAAVANDDNTGQTVSADDWADDVCGAVGAWAGQLEAIRDELDQSNYAARRNDGGSGDSVERTLVVRVAIDRAIQSTNDTLRQGLKRAGSPEGAGGQAASLALRGWALKTERDLRTRLIIVNAQSRVIGLIVDSAREFISIPSSAVQPPNETISGLKGKYLEAIATLGERIILILNIDEIIDLAENLSVASESA